MRIFFPILLVASFAVAVLGAEMQPDFGKLTPVPLCPAAIEAARTNNIPIEGIDPSGEAGALIPGDSVTALVTLFEKGGRKSQWLLYVEAVEPTAEEKTGQPRKPVVCYVGAGDKVDFAGARAPVSLRLLGPFADAKQKPRKAGDQRARITLEKGFLGIGLNQAAATFHRMRQNKLKGNFQIRGRPFTETEIAEGKKAIATLQLSLEEQRAIAGSQLALMSYFQLVQETPGLDDLFYEVVKLPSVWSVVRNLGVTPTLELQRDHVGPTGTADWNLAPQTACYTFPLALRINAQPALTATLVVAPPSPPLLACGGIVGLLAEKPGDKQTYLILRIISARHGKHAGRAAPGIEAGS